MLQYGRQNIENVKKRNGTWHRDDDAEEEHEPLVEKQNMQNSTRAKHKLQNGVLGNNVIARSKDLILVPEPEMQNHRNHLEESKSQASTVVGKSEVPFVSPKLC